VNPIKFTRESVGEILVLPIAKDGDRVRVQSSDSKIDAKSIEKVLAKIGASAEVDEVIKVPLPDGKLIVTTGLGAITSNYEAELLRRAAGSAARSLNGEKSATFSFPVKSSSHLSAVAEGAALGAYIFTEFKGTTKKDLKPALDQIVIQSNLIDSLNTKDIAKRTEVIAKYTFLIRDLINTPPSHLTPAIFADQMKKLATSLKLNVEVLDEKALKSKGYGGITAVGQGSANPPRLLRISYKPKSAKKHFALVGKGITFDTGGLALKPANGMEAMKCDMGGAAAVIATVLAAAELKLNVGIDAWAPMAENMVSDTATRPSDIIKIYGGKTVEVLNPDAEGRLILADALMRAQEFNKNLNGIIDVATLTGAQVVALGSRTSAVMTNNEELAEQFLISAKAAGEAFWPMPLPEELRASLDSPVADIANIGERMGGMLVAGLFLKEFVSNPWLHLDIAGPAFNEGKAHGYTPVGGTGVALRSLISLFSSME
jgi:leucyl aminopeptidase